MPLCYFGRMRTSFLVLSLCAATLAVSPARADLYKWVDEAGVTHYSDHAPTTSSATVVPERISVYKPDPGLLRAMSAPKSALDNRVAVLEQQLRRERRYRDEAASSGAAAQQAAYDQCVAERRVDCDQSGTYPLYGAPVIVVGGRRHRPVAPVVPVRPITATGAIMPGTFHGPNAITAGNVVTFAPRAALNAGRR